MKYKDIQKELKKVMKPNRYTHTVGVIESAVQLAQAHNFDKDVASLAALLHDCAKHIGDEEKIAMCREYGVAISDAERANPGLLHAKCGAIVAEHAYGVNDYDILHAIKVHTTGQPEMNTLDKIIFIADYIEPNRTKQPHLKELRAMALKDLDKTTYMILKDTIEYLNTRVDQTTDPMTELTYNYYKKIVSAK